MDIQIATKLVKTALSGARGEKSKEWLKNKELYACFRSQ
jgi:hypothetical protein